MQITHVNNIQKYSIHDGDGIRTVIFFKGCPLSCLWCHNPESRRFEPELLFNQEKCRLCRACISACPQRKIAIDSKTGRLAAPVSCSACGACVEACVYRAREIAGREVTVGDLICEIDKDAMFYEESGGGVTLSGGEVMAQDMDFVEALLRQCRRRGYRVNIDTCGHAPFENFQRVLGLVDVFLYDIKIIDSRRHKKYTGQGNELILENLVKLSNAGARVFIRIPLIEGINCSEDSINSVLDFIRPLNIERIYLLPYHRLGSHKAEQMGIPGPDLKPPTEDRLNAIKLTFQKNGYIARIGG